MPKPSDEERRLKILLKAQARADASRHLGRFITDKEYDEPTKPRPTKKKPNAQIESKFTAPQLKLIIEMDLAKLVSKQFINKQYPIAEYPPRSGNLETPTKPEHKGLMGQPQNPHGTMADKPGRETSENSVHAVPSSMRDPTGLITLGQPYQRRLSDGVVGDDASMHPSTTKAKPTRLQGPAENPGDQTYTSFGNRYPGAR